MRTCPTPSASLGTGLAAGGRDKSMTRCMLRLANRYGTRVPSPSVRLFLAKLITLQPRWNAKSYQSPIPAAIRATISTLTGNEQTYDVCRHTYEEASSDVFPRFPIQSLTGYRHECGLGEAIKAAPPHCYTPSYANPTTISQVKMVAKLISFALSLSLAAASAKDGYFGLAGRGLLVERNSGCLTGGPQSCHNTTTQTDLCCFEAPGVSAFLSDENFRDIDRCVSIFRVYLCRLR